jgi:hypothetical protein
MNDLENLVPIAATALHIAPTTLLLAVGILHLAAKVTARLIPDNKTGILGSIRKAAGVIGVEPSSRIADGVSIKDVATAAAELPEVASQVAAPKG